MNEPASAKGARFDPWEFLKRAIESGLMAELTADSWRALCAVLATADSHGTCVIQYSQAAPLTGMRRDEFKNCLASLLVARHQDQPVVMSNDWGTPHEPDVIRLAVNDRLFGPRIDLRKIQGRVESMGRTLNHTWLEAVGRWADIFGFTTDLILALLEYGYERCKRHLRLSYIESVAAGWAHEGIRTVEDLERSRAAEKTGQRAQDPEAGDLVARLMSYLRRRSEFSVPEVKLINSWVAELGIPEELVFKAVDGVVRLGRSPSVPNIHALLTEWRAAGVLTPQAAERDIACREAARSQKGQAGGAEPRRRAKKARYAEGDFSDYNELVISSDPDSEESHRGK
ncbi:MAG: DnaD domain protein [Actinobacteria bacterium]|nr:DnaD domain protein [Actinomycetota bacterium]